jgi:acetylglutamate kinase
MVYRRKARKTVTDPDSNIERVLDLGFVGEPVEVDRTLLEARGEIGDDPGAWRRSRRGATGTPTISMPTPLPAPSPDRWRRQALLFLTDVPGVLDKNGKLIKELTVSEARALIEDGTISGGMIPKVETCIEAIERGVKGVVILNGKVPHAVLLELFTEHGAGNLLRP